MRTHQAVNEWVEITVEGRGRRRHRVMEVGEHEIVIHENESANASALIRQIVGGTNTLYQYRYINIHTGDLCCYPMHLHTIDGRVVFHDRGFF